MKKIEELKILVIGGGPVGLSAALFLSHKGIKPRIVEKLTEVNKYSRALAINPRTLELFDKINAVAEFIKDSYRVNAANFFIGSRLVINNFEVVNHKFPFISVQPQYVSERALSELLNQRGITIEKGVIVKEVSTTNELVKCELQASDGRTESLVFDYIFCADGAHSAIRKSLGLKFNGSTYNSPLFLCDVTFKTNLNPNDFYLFFPKSQPVFFIRIERDSWRIIGTDPEILDNLPKGHEIQNVLWQSNFVINNRIIEKFRFGNVFFGGDAAHVHSPAGGRGMNLGIEDAFVFAELLAENRLNEYDKLRKNAVKKTLSKIDMITKVILGENFFYRI
ncbi:pentachlorophenol monooxygenase [Brachionus plicatilis]|uniref:Pentachlorophenol monooxygenase n=1 Tax=Brachionus plicatilis TaxID=10195 RepID=A0A3M7S721_BRAPC|nr:pentachlorophenol monooxygenase [Brachionus plicatilis]